MCKLSLFGSPALECRGRSEYIPRRKARALLAYLAVTQQAHSREALVALLWPEYDFRLGRADLSRTLSSLRTSLGSDYIQADRDSAALNQEADLWVDVLHFRTALESCRREGGTGLDDESCRTLVAAVDLYGADFLAGFTLPDSPAFDEWQLLQTEALRRDLGWALDQLIRTFEARHDLAQAVTYAQRWVGLDPLHEPAQRRLIALYARRGQRAEAHRQYQACVRLLQEELGVDPQPETKQLYEEIKKGTFNAPLIAERFQLVMQSENLLGQGSLGEVYRGLDTRLDQPVAIKVARARVIREQPELLERIVREGKALRQLDHPHIAKVIAAAVEKDRHYLIMEYVSRGSLKERLAQEGPLPLASGLEIGLGLADALAHAHHLNIIHSDLKPSNVLLAKDGSPRLTDFGLARLGDISQLTQAKSVVGTLGYLSPEACQGESLDARSDIWSLGILLVEMLTGERPFRGETPAAVITAILNQPLPDLRQRYPHLPAPLVDLIEQMLVKERNGRLPSMRLVGAELEAIQQGRSLSAAARLQKLDQEIKFFYSFDQVRIAYATVGTGPPLVFAATYLRHLEFEWESPVWKHWLEALAKEHTLIRYDERGCGLSDWDVSDISFEAWVRDLEALVSHLGLERFSLVALSQGGPVAIAYASRHPEKVTHLVLHGAYARGRFHRVNSPQAMEEAQMLLSLIRLGWGRDNPAFRQVFFTQHMPDATKEQLVWFDELMRVSMSADNAVRAETEMYNINVLDLLSELRVPTLITHCQYDESIPLAEGRLLASQIPGARFVALDSKNHLLLPDEPAWEQFVYEVHRFLASDPRPPAARQPVASAPAGPQDGLSIRRFEWPEPHPARLQPFVVRSQELAQLNEYLDEALAANGRIVFVTGGSGRGKTSLLEEFTRRAQMTHTDLIAASGSGSALAGAGDPYLPFREVMGLLAGDLAARRSGGPLSFEQARRLWALLPHTAQAILEHGPQLLDVFVSGRQLVARAETGAPPGSSWLADLRAVVAQRRAAHATQEQSALFGQFTHVLHHLAQKRPLLITLDDLQWIDEASIGLLFHLGRRLSGSQILIVGAYRPDELPHGQAGEPHPLVQVLEELKRTYGDVFIDLAQADQGQGRAFVEAFLDTEPNDLGPAFRQALFQQTGGHPLFTVELLRDMQSRGDLVQDEQGQWRAGQALDWSQLPARIEAVISRRIDRLDETARSILQAASVEGESFTAEVVARVLGMDDRLLLHSLSSQLGSRRRLVRERGEIKAGSSYLSSYQFSHTLFQQYLYRQLSPGERRLWHGAVAGALAYFYPDDLDQVVVQLAYHYTAAGLWPDAARCHSLAGDLSYRTATLPAAVRHYQSALEHWPASDVAGQAQTLRKLGECLWVMGQQPQAIEMLQASADQSLRAGDELGAGAAQRLLGRVYWEAGQPDKAGRCYRQALSLLEHAPESDELAWALAGLSNYHMHLGEYDESIRLGEQALALARRSGAEEIIIQCLCDLGSARSSTGDWAGIDLERESLERALALNRPHDAGRAYLYIAEGLMYLGRYEQARATLEDALAYTRRMQVPYIAGSAARMRAEVDWLTGHWAEAVQLLAETNQAGEEQPGSLPQLYLALVQGRLNNDLGQAEQAQPRLARALSRPVRTMDPRVALMGELARAEAQLGHPAAAASAVGEILEWTDQARYLYPNAGMALLFACRSPLAGDTPEMLGYARSALQQLERLDQQFGTPATAACRWEGQGWLSLAEGEAAQAQEAFEGAASHWRALGHPYDQARALSGFARVHSLAGDYGSAERASEQALGLIEALADRLEDGALKASFLNSGLVQEIRAGLSGPKNT